jgi:hypothetical protein
MAQGETMKIDKEALLKIIDELSITYDIDNGVGVVHSIDRQALIDKINLMEVEREIQRKRLEEQAMLSLC